MLRVQPTCKRSYRSMADLVDLDLHAGHLASAPPAVWEFAIKSRQSLMANVILDALKYAEQMLALARPTDLWVSDALIMHADAQVVLGRYAEACWHYLVARHHMRAHAGARKNSRVIMEKMDDMIDYLQYALSKRPRDRPPARPFRDQVDPKTCDEKILSTMSQGQDVHMLTSTHALRALLRHRLATGLWTSPRSEMLLIPDDGSQPRIVNITRHYDLQWLLGSKYVIRELLYSEDVLEQRKGEARGVPEGHTYTTWECLTREDSGPQRPNSRAQNLLQATYLSGPVLVQVVTRLKNAPDKPSRVLQRAAPRMAELDSGAWGNARCEWIALNETAYFGPITAYYRLESATQEDGLWSFW